MNVRVFQIHKRSAYVFKDIQDKYAVDLNSNILAVSDGATQGYKSEIWAENLVSDFLTDPVFTIPDLIEKLKENALRFSKIDFPGSDNYALKALETRKKELGSFATFLGVNISENKITFISSGDVCGFVYDSESITSFPFSTVEELDKDKGFLGTAKILNNDIPSEQFRIGEQSLKRGSKVLLMTDAIARMCLRNPDNLNVINTISSFENFKDFIISKWDSKELEEDDITVMIIDPAAPKLLTAFLPPEDFFFPKEEKPEYTQIKKPFILKDDLTEQEMKEIQDQLNLLNNKINIANQQNAELAKQLKSHKLLTLLSLALGLSALLIGGYLFGKSLVKKEKEKEVVAAQEESVVSIPQVIPSVVPVDSLSNKSDFAGKDADKISPPPASVKDDKKTNKSETVVKSSENKKDAKEETDNKEADKKELKKADKVVTKKDSVKK